MALSTAESKLIRQHFKRDPTTLERSILENLWSEHCSYRHSKVFVSRYQATHRFGAVGVGENAGGVSLPSGKTLFFKIESHNHPSFIEPREGAATGVGGILRDIFAMGARPLMIGDLLCFGEPGQDPWMQHLIAGVVEGISSYGNSVGIANAGGDTKFNSAFKKNILVNVFALGVRDAGQAVSAKIDSRFRKEPLEIHLIGGRTGCDGIGGAAMASEAFGTATFGAAGVQTKRHHVQIGDPYMEKRIMDICIELMPQVVAIQDCGAAGLTSSLFEICHKNNCGMTLQLDRVPLRQATLKPEEIMVSESQERMILISVKSVSDQIRATCERWDVPHGVIGTVEFKQKTLDINYKGQKLAACDPEFMCEGHRSLYEPIQPRAKSIALSPPTVVRSSWASVDWVKASETLVRSLATCDRHWIYDQYDQHVGGRTLLGPRDHPVSLHLAQVDVSEPTQEVVGVRLSQAPELFAKHPYAAAWQSVREGMIQLWASGLTPLGVTNGLNFASPEDPHVLRQLDEATLGLNDACVHYEVPVVSGNVSLYNQSGGAGILPTVALGFVGAGQLPDVLQRVKVTPPLKVIQIEATEGQVCVNPDTLNSQDLSSQELQACLMSLPSYEAALKKTLQSLPVVHAFVPYLKPIWQSFLPWLVRGLPRRLFLEAGQGIQVSLTVDDPAMALGFGYGRAWVVVPQHVKIPTLTNTHMREIGVIEVRPNHFDRTAAQCTIKQGGKSFVIDLKKLQRLDQESFVKWVRGA